MFQNLALAQRLSDEHQQSMQQAAEKARRAHDVRNNEPVQYRRRLLAKLRAEMSNL